MGTSGTLWGGEEVAVLELPTAGGVLQQEAFRRRDTELLTCESPGPGTAAEVVLCSLIAALDE